MPDRTLPMRTASVNYWARCVGKLGTTGGRDSFAWWRWRNREKCAGCFQLRRKELFWMSRGAITDSGTIRFSSSLLLEKRMRRFRARKKIYTAIAGRRFIRRLIFYLPRARSEETEMAPG